MLGRPQQSGKAWCGLDFEGGFWGNVGEIDREMRVIIGEKTYWRPRAGRGVGFRDAKRTYSLPLVWF